MQIINRVLNPKQKEVWKTVETYTSLIMKGDIEKFLGYYHDDYSGWDYFEALPVNKEDLKNELWQLPKRKTTSYHLIPVAVTVINDMAIVHYYYSIIYINTDGIEKEKQGRNTDILIKQNNKWILIGDHTGSQ